MCVFARQNLTVDPPFSRVDLVMCRNVLIYMSPALQERLLPVFHFALNRGGFLVLGLAETVGGFGDLFELVNREHKIYRKKETTRQPPLTFMADEWLAGAPAARPATVPPPAVDFQREAERVALSHYAPPSVLVNEALDIQHFRGRTAPFLEAPPGQPTTNILRMAKEGLFIELQSALAEAKASRVPVAREHLRILDRGAELPFTLRIVPVHPAGTTEMAFLVLFETVSPPWSPIAIAEAPVTSTAPSGMPSGYGPNCCRSKQYLQSVLEDKDAKTQELRAAHEEVLSSGEELREHQRRARDDEGGTGQSANEELTTVNEQFESRNRELDTLTDDLSNFISSADLPMVTVGRDLRIRRLTPAAQRAFNLLPTDVGRSIEHIKFALDLDDIGTAIRTVMTSLAPWQREVADRGGRWWLVRVHPYRTSDNRIDGATIVAIDIDLVKRTHELVEERDYSRAVIQTIIDPLAVLDADCRLTLANEAFYDLFGLRPEQVEGRPLWNSLPDVWSEPAVRRALTAACGGQAALANLEIDRILPDRGRRTLVFNATPIVRSGRATLLLLAVEDVTQSREAEALRVDAETLRQVDRRKDEFMGILAHELRNPLAPMRFALELLQRADDLPPDAVRPVQVLERQVGHMVRIIDDLLDVSRITQGKLELRKELVSLSSVVTGAAELCRPAVESAHHTLTVSLPVEPVMLVVDPVRLTQVLVNVINNAAKFTPPGGHIWVIAETAPDVGDHPDRLRIRVRDDGIGIPADLRAKIFDMFMQGDRSLERTRGGLGVGLTLARNLVSLHGGTVEVRSDGVDAGTEVVIELPLDPALQPLHPPVDPGTEPRASRSLRILIAEDNEDGRNMLTLFLEQEGHEVATAVDGPQALAVSAAFHPEVAILDIGMPGMDGYQVAEQLRRSHPTPPLLIALSGLGQAEDKTRAADAGFSRHFTKPVDVRALTRALADVPKR